MLLFVKMTVLNSFQTPSAMQTDAVPSHSYEQAFVDTACVHRIPVGTERPAGCSASLLSDSTIAFIKPT